MGPKAELILVCAEELRNIEEKVYWYYRYVIDRDDLDRMLMRDERANKDQESRAIRAIRAQPGLAARGAQQPACTIMEP